MVVFFFCYMYIILMTFDRFQLPSQPSHITTTPQLLSIHQLINVPLICSFCQLPQPSIVLRAPRLLKQLRSDLRTTKRNIDRTTPLTLEMIPALSFIISNCRLSSTSFSKSSKPRFYDLEMKGGEVGDLADGGVLLCISRTHNRHRLPPLTRSSCPPSPVHKGPC